MDNYFLSYIDKISNEKERVRRIEKVKKCSNTFIRKEGFKRNKYALEKRMKEKFQNKNYYKGHDLEDNRLCKIYNSLLELRELLVIFCENVNYDKQALNTVIRRIKENIVTLSIGTILGNIEINNTCYDKEYMINNNMKSSFSSKNNVLKILGIEDYNVDEGINIECIDKAILKLFEIKEKRLVKEDKINSSFTEKDVRNHNMCICDFMNKVK